MAPRQLPWCMLAAWLAVPLTGAVRLKSNTVRGPADLHAGSLQRKSVDRSHFLVEMEILPDALLREQWQRRGIRVVGRVPPAGLLLSVPDGVVPDAPGMLWAGRLGAEDKISALVGTDEQATGAYLVEFYPDVDMDAARELVLETGMQLQDHPDLLPGQLLVLGGVDQVTALAAWDEVAYVFPASADLLAGNHVLACAGAATADGPMGQYVKASDGWSAGSSGIPLSYVFTALTPKLPISTVESEILRAFNEWTKYAPLLFSQGNNASAPRTISILFASGSHGDGYPFDGPGKVLAHTFYPAPPNPEPIAGDMHFDADEAWGDPQQMDLYSVALHETGHALGLGHSDQPGAVMYPYYRLQAQLTSDDIAGLRAIYAAVSTTPATPALALQVTTPASSSVTVTASTIAMAGTVTGGSGTPQVTWTSNQGMSGKASGSAVWSIAAVALNVGSNIITITATDGAGAVASRVTTVTRQAASTPTPAPTPPAIPTAPAAPPALQITTPGFTVVSTSASSIAIGGTASAGTTSVTWTNSVGGSGTAAGTTTWSATVPLIVGTNTLTVRACNAAGSSWRSLTVVRR